MNSERFKQDLHRLKDDADKLLKSQDSNKVSKVKAMYCLVEQVFELNFGTKDNVYIEELKNANNKAYANAETELNRYIAIIESAISYMENYYSKEDSYEIDFSEE